MIEVGHPCSANIVLCQYCGEQFVSMRSVRLHMERSKRCNRVMKIFDEQSVIRADGTHDFVSKDAAVHVSTHVSRVPQFAVGRMSRYESTPVLFNTSPSSQNIIPRKKAAKMDYKDVAGSAHQKQSNVRVVKSLKTSLPKHIVFGFDYLMKQIDLDHLRIGGKELLDSDIASGICYLPSFDELKSKLSSTLNQRGKLIHILPKQDGIQSKNASQVRNNLIYDVQFNATSDYAHQDPLASINGLTMDDIEDYISCHVDKSLLFDESSDLSSRVDSDTSENDNDEDAQPFNDHFQNHEYDFDQLDPEINDDVGGQQLVVEDTEHDVNDFQSYHSGYKDRQVVLPIDRMNCELFTALEKSGAPLYLFDDIHKWAEKYQRVLRHSTLQNRKGFIARMEKKMYGEYITHMRPNVTAIELSTGRTAAVTTFSFKMGLLSKLMDTTLMTGTNLLLDVEDPFKKNATTDNYGEVNSGRWYSDAYEYLCRGHENTLLIPIALYIDGLNADKFGNISLEPIVAAPLLFKRDIRNKPNCWFTLGYIESLTKVPKEKGKGKKTQSREKLQEYHDMCKYILRELKDIQTSGGISFDLTIDGTTWNNVCGKVAVQFIIGDCKGNDILCGRYGSHSDKVPYLVRDCNVKTEDADDTEHVCQYWVSSGIERWNKKQCEDHSFHKINNAFTELCYGGNKHGVFGSTPPEILHQFQLGICQYMIEEFLREIYESSLNELNRYVIAIVAKFSRQSDRSFPNMDAFRNGLEHVRILKGKEKEARIFMLFVAIMCEDVCENISTTSGNGAERPAMGMNAMKSWLELCESTMGIGEWMRQKTHSIVSIDGVVDVNNDENSPSQIKMRQYMRLYKRVVNRQVGVGMRFTKFHQMLHLVRCIKYNGSLLNCDGSRPESNAKQNTKNHYSCTQKRSESVTYQTAQRLHESTLVKSCIKTYMGVGQFEDLTSCVKIEEEQDAHHDGMIGGSKFTLSMKYVSDGDPNGYNVDVEDDMTTMVADKHNYRVYLDWKNKLPVHGFDKRIVEAVGKRLFLHRGSGGCLRGDSHVKGFTEYRMGNTLFRCHPSYRSGNQWMDWGMFQFEDNEASIPAKILMLLDLTHTEIMSPSEHRRFRRGIEPEIDEEDLSSFSDIEDADDESIPYNIDRDCYLSKSLWCIVQQADKSSLDNYENNEFQLNSRIATRFTVENDYRLVPLETLTSGCFVVRNNPLKCDEDPSNISAFYIHPRHSWCTSTFMATT